MTDVKEEHRAARRRVVSRYALAVIALFITTAPSSDGVSPPARIDTSTVISLREYVDVRFEAQEKAVQSALAAADRAVQKAETATEKRFESVNEFRASLSDNTRSLMPRLEAEQQFRAIAEKLDNLTARMNAIDDRSRGANEAWGYIFGFVGIAVALVTVGIRMFRRPG